ncbi:MAG: hypothetical protein WCI18_06845, partial [Pseudomonadota bacterium]
MIYHSFEWTKRAYFREMFVTKPTTEENILRNKLSWYFSSMQRNLFPGFTEELGPTTATHLKVIVALDMIQVENFTAYKNPFVVGRRPVNRDAMASAFIAKSILNIPSTVALID